MKVMTSLNPPTADGDGVLCNSSLQTACQRTLTKHNYIPNRPRYCVYKHAFLSIALEHLSLSMTV